MFVFLNEFRSKRLEKALIKRNSTSTHWTKYAGDWPSCC